MDIVLVMFRGEKERRSFSITRDVTVIGRREDCDFRIPLGEISRKHCRLIKNGESIAVEDLGSSNGTFHNGQRVQEATLIAGDTLQVGSVAFVVQVDGQPAEDELQPVTAGATRTRGAGPEEIPLDADDSVIATRSVSAPEKSSSASGDFDPMSILEEGTGSDADVSDSNIGAEMLVDIANRKPPEDED